MVPYRNFYIGLYVANTCKVYTFYMGPIFTVISLYIFAVWTRAPSVLQATEIAPYIAFFHSAEK